MGLVIYKGYQSCTSLITVYADISFLVRKLIAENFKSDQV